MLLQLYLTLLIKGEEADGSVNSKLSLANTVFPHIVSAETILF